MLRIPPFFRDFAVLDDSKKYTPFPQNLEHIWLPLFMLSEGTGMLHTHESMSKE